MLDHSLTTLSHEAVVSTCGGELLKEHAKIIVCARKDGRQWFGQQPEYHLLCTQFAVVGCHHHHQHAAAGRWCRFRGTVLLEHATQQSQWGCCGCFTPQSICFTGGGVCVTSASFQQMWWHNSSVLVAVQAGLFFSHKFRHAHTHNFFLLCLCWCQCRGRREQGRWGSLLPTSSFPPQGGEVRGASLFSPAVRFPTEKDSCGGLTLPSADCLQLKRRRAAPAGAGSICMVKFTQCFQLPAASNCSLLYRR